MQAHCMCIIVYLQCVCLYVSSTASLYRLMFILFLICNLQLIYQHILY